MVGIRERRLSVTWYPVFSWGLKITHAMQRASVTWGMSAGGIWHKGQQVVTNLNAIPLALPWCKCIKIA